MFVFLAVAKEEIRWAVTTRARYFIGKYIFVGVAESDIKLWNCFEIKTVFTKIILKNYMTFLLQNKKVPYFVVLELNTSINFK